MPTPSNSTSRQWAVLALLALTLCAGLYLDYAAVRPRSADATEDVDTAPARNAKSRPASDVLAPLARRWLPFAIAGLLASVPAVRNATGRVLDRLRQPIPRTRRRVTLAIFCAASIYLAATATWQRRDLNAKEQDESMYLVQTQQLARGHLWLPQHPCADFFESFHVMVKPKYAGIYFPGTALAYAPSVWLHLPPWVFSLLIAGAGVAMTYRVAAELIDGLAGSLAALLMIAAIQFRHLSTMVMSHTLMILLALLMTWAYLRWRRDRRLGFAALAGLFAGWAAITRPVDAIAYAAPLLLAVLWDLRLVPWPTRARTAAVVLAAAAPLLALQLVLDYGVTGHLLRTPVSVYHETYWPQAAINYAGDANHPLPATDKPQFKQYRDDYVLPAYEQLRSTPPLTLLAKVRLPMLFNVALPSLLLAGMMLLAPFELRRPARWAFVLAAPVFLLAYSTFPFFRPQYATVVLPPLLLAVLLGARAVEDTFPASRAAWSTFFTLALAILALLNLPELNGRGRGDQISPTPILHAFEVESAKLAHKPAIVLVRHTPGQSRHEPTYNNDVAWPDDAHVIRAHDLGPRNAELFRYYADHQPGRYVYLFDKVTRQMTPLGPVTELADKPATRPSVLPAPK